MNALIHIPIGAVNMGSTTRRYCARDAKSMIARYVELQCASHFSFLRGASSAEELFATAAMLGMEALAVTDWNTLSGIVRAHEAAKITGVRLIIGCRLQLGDGSELLIYPTDRPAYSLLTRLLSLGKSRAGKAKCDLTWDDVAAWSQGSVGIFLPDRANGLLRMQLIRMRDIFGSNAYCALSLRRRPRDHLRLHEIATMATGLGVPTVATNDVLFHAPDRRILQDVVTCIRERTTIDDVGFRRERHADRYLKAPEEMARLFKLWPEAVARSGEIAERCRFSLHELAYQYPHEVCLPGLTPQQALEKLTWEGAANRYPEGLPERRQIAASRTRSDRDTGLCALLPDRELHRRLRAQQGYPLPGPRFGRQFCGLLCARHHLHRPRAQ